MQDQARVVIIGGGITGCCILYHLAEAGWTDVVLLEKGELTSGATCQAAGLLTQFNTSPTMMKMRKYSAEMYARLGAYTKVGSLRIAAGKEQYKTLLRDMSQARGIGLELEMISPREMLEFIPWMSDKNLYGGVYLPNDGHLDPHAATHAVAKAATDLGATIHTDTLVTGIKLTARGEVSGVHTANGDIKCETVINAAGIWAAQIASMAGVYLPTTPVVHQHAALEPVDGHEIPADSPCFRDYDYLIYGRPEGGSYLFGGWEIDPAVCWVDGVPWSHGAAETPNDFDRFMPLMENAVERFPFLAEAGLVRLVAHPDAFTPDGKPLLGPWPGLKGFWLAGASCMHGFGGGGGFGKALSQWLIEGETEWDLHSYRPWRFGRNHRDPYYAGECARECYKYYYRTRYPNDESIVGRPRRISPLHHRWQDLGAVFGQKNGWERPNYARPDQPWRRAGEEQREWGGWVKPGNFDFVAAEHEAVRERVGLFDLTSFGKIDVRGPGTTTLLQRLTANDLAAPEDTVIYTQLLNKRGGVEADVVATRLAREHYRIITGSAFVDHDLGWIRASMGQDDSAVELVNVTEDYACIGIWGPAARSILQAVTEDDLSNAAFPYRTAKTITVKGVRLLAQRVAYVGELGWELYPPTEQAIRIWDRLWAAGREFKMSACGYKSIDSLRLEKGHLSFGNDMTPLENPFEARLGFCVKFEQEGDFLGREALLGIRETDITSRLCNLIIGDEEWLPVYGGEAVLHEGRTITRLRSTGYGYTVKANIGYAYLPTELSARGAELEIDVFGERIAARVGTDVLYDPQGDALRS